MLDFDVAWPRNPLPFVFKPPYHHPITPFSSIIISFKYIARRFGIIQAHAKEIRLCRIGSLGTSPPAPGVSPPPSTPFIYAT